jgi:hypothetical protein
MTTTDFTTAIRVNKTPGEVFDAINDPGGWWSQAIEGTTDKQGEIFFYHYRDMHYCKIQLEELVPGKKVVWLVLDNYFHFTKDKSEWKGTRTIFDISSNGDQTEMRFTHEGLVPEYECFEICESAWTGYITKSLHDLIINGKGKPNDKDDDSFDTTLFEKWKSSN